MPISAIAIPCLVDNYAWLLAGPQGRLAVCDPAEAEPVIAAVEARGGQLEAILLTHHHADHVGGVAGLTARYRAEVIGHAADAARLPPLDRPVRAGESLTLLGERVEVIATDGHTRGHIAYHFPTSHILLCGDTLFSLGCGRVFEGTAEEMFASLRRLAALPPETLVCCGHEYTLSNARFALTIEPDNASLQARVAEAERLRAAGQPSVPSRLAEELAANPFLRATDAATFARLRAAKDAFR